MQSEQQFYNSLYTETLPDGRIRTTHRVNVMDLWDHPELLGAALSG